MDSIDGNIISLIASFSTLERTECLQTLSKTFCAALHGSYVASYMDHRDHIRARFSHYVVALMGGIHEMTMYPVLQWRNRFGSGDGYIDGILVEDMPYPVMTGIDGCGRCFVALKTLSYNRCGKVYVAVDTLFQRKSSMMDTWTSGSRYYTKLFQELGYFLANGNFRHRYLETNIRNLLNGTGYIMQADTYKPDAQGYLEACETMTPFKLCE